VLELSSQPTDVAANLDKSLGVFKARRSIPACHDCLCRGGRLYIKPMDRLAADNEVLRIAVQWHAQGRALAMATVVETWGSSPRPIGSRLVVDQEGHFLGSVSGGCVEAEVVSDALDVIANGAPRLREFGVSDQTAWGAGLSCGGRIKIFIERIE
jgi:hypothetical protein